MNRYRESRDEEISSAQRTAHRTRVMAQSSSSSVSQSSSTIKSSSVSQSPRRSGTTSLKSSPFPRFVVPTPDTPNVQYIIPPLTYKYPEPLSSGGIKLQIPFPSPPIPSDLNYNVRKNIEDRDWADSVAIISERGTPWRLMILLGKMCDMEKKIESIDKILRLPGRGVVSGIDSVPIEHQDDQKEMKIGDEHKNLVEEMRGMREEIGKVTGESKTLMEDAKKTVEENERIVNDHKKIEGEMKKMREEMKKMREENRRMEDIESRLSGIESERKNEAERHKVNEDAEKNRIEEIQRLKEEIKKRDERENKVAELSSLLDLERRRVDELKEQLTKIVSDMKVLSDRSEKNDAKIREEVRSAVEGSKSEAMIFIDSEMKNVHASVESMRLTMREEFKSISESGMNVVKEEMKTLRTVVEGEMKVVRGENAKVLEELGKFKEEEKTTHSVERDLSSSEKEQKAITDMKSRLDGVESNISKLLAVKASTLSLLDEKKEQPRSSTPLNTLTPPVTVNFPQVQESSLHPQYYPSLQLPQTQYSLPPRPPYQAPIQYPQYSSGVPVAVSSTSSQQYRVSLPLPASPFLPVQASSPLPVTPRYNERDFPSGLQYTEKYRGEYKKMSLEDTETAFAYFLLGEGHSKLLGIDMILPFTADAMENEYKADHPRAMALARAAYSTKMYDKKATDKNALQYSHTGPRRVTTHKGIFGILDSFCALVGLRVNRKGSSFVIIKRQT